MYDFLPTFIYRHRKENLKKCTLLPLEGHQNFSFFSYPKDPLPPLDHYLLLTLNAPVLSKKDTNFGLFLIDSTWHYAPVIERKVTILKKRSLPKEIQTAYPRKQTGCQDPLRGLASIEALYAAFFILGRKTKGLLDAYFWKEIFLDKNRDFFKKTL